jgi:hypothetical protein
MSILFAPFVLPLCLALPASAIGISLQRRVSSYYFDHWTQAAIYLSTVFGITLFGRLALNINTGPTGFVIILVGGAVFPLLLARRMSNQAPTESDEDDTAKKGFASLLFASSVLALGLISELPYLDLPIARFALFVFALLPAAVGGIVLCDGT